MATISKYKIYTLLFSLILSLTFLNILLIVNNVKEKESKHNYVETTVVSKYYLSNNNVYFYGMFYFGGSNYTFFLISEEYDDSGKKIKTWTTNVTQSIYNSYQKDDKLYICVKHEKIKEAE